MPMGKSRFQELPLWCFYLLAFVQKGTTTNVDPLLQGGWMFKDQIDREIDNMGDRKPSPSFSNSNLGKSQNWN